MAFIGRARPNDARSWETRDTGSLLKHLLRHMIQLPSKQSTNSIRSMLSTACSVLFLSRNCSLLFAACLGLRDAHRYFRSSESLENAFWTLC